MLKEVGAPYEPEQIGIERERLLVSHAQARMIRLRYTVLDLVAETGLWTPCVEESFKEGGFWYE
jgi:glycerol-1-phosphate dehydrogenase [NAD(P)+]